MSRTKYQIFVSSTYDDLKQEREQIIKAALEMGHIPVGMEMFSAADDEQWKIITRHIDESDYYAVIVAHRYGSIVPVENISYTEKEFDYAVSQGVPVIGFVLDDHASWPADRIDTEPKKKKAINAFRAKVRKKPVGFWSTAEELHGKFAISLGKLITTNPRPGWARASDVAGPEVAAELARLSNENSELRARLVSLDVTERPRRDTIVAWLNEWANLSVFIEYLRSNPTMASKDQGGYSVYWYKIVKGILSVNDSPIRIGAVITLLQGIVTEQFYEGPGKDRTMTVRDVRIEPHTITQIARALIENKVIVPMPLGLINESSWQLTEYAGLFRSILTEMQLS